MQSHRERRFIPTLIHNFTTRWRQVVNCIRQPLYDWVEKRVVPTEQEWSGTVRKPKIVCLCQDWTLDHPPPSPIIMGCDLPTVHVKTACNQLSIQLKSLYDHPTNRMLKELLKSLVVGTWSARFHIKISDLLLCSAFMCLTHYFPHRIQILAFLQEANCLVCEDELDLYTQCTLICLQRVQKD
jgi:hypothetical protein